MHFLAIKVVFSCLGHNGKFVSSSNAREILCLVSKIPCVARYKGPWGKVRVVPCWFRPCGGKGLVLRPPQSIATQVARVEEEKEQNKSRQIKIN